MAEELDYAGCRQRGPTLVYVSHSTEAFALTRSRDHAVHPPVELRIEGKLAPAKEQSKYSSSTSVDKRNLYGRLSHVGTSVGTSPPQRGETH